MFNRSEYAFEIPAIKPDRPLASIILDPPIEAKAFRHGPAYVLQLIKLIFGNKHEELLIIGTCSHPRSTSSLQFKAWKRNNSTDESVQRLISRFLHPRWFCGSSSRRSITETTQIIFACLRNSSTERPKGYPVEVSLHGS